MNWRAKLLKLDGLMPHVSDTNALEWGTLADCAEDAELVFLGLDTDESGGTKPCFAAVPAVGDASPRMANPRLWAVMATLSPDDLAIYGGARSVVDWHARHRFCAACGGSTELAKGGWQRNCTNCGAQHFPRTDPVTIMLVEHDDKLLLGRGLGWPEKAYSALAGFVEPGESIEEAVAREVLEESGITAREVHYIASQPWPFPSQLMMGCTAIAEDTEITLDETELADARWFTRDEVQAAMSGDADAPMNTPPKQAIAHHLLQWWLDKGK
ncbi:NAD(+) diphosphatase [Altererythrobacter sp. RZ02]|uniref:NAD(+) diphosphatase n=2 Tax=Pontixanthobacter rizhaonensis TaxID=2730337 RepID=A0A848QMK0_9SPHN|nr:NAD(+) diphosphatase [Pontixanthobacter rizhaonensis]